MSITDNYQKLARKISSARRVTVLTGAGVSAASGIPTFRGSDGLWKNYKPEELAHINAFMNDPITVWKWYDWRRGLIAGAGPNRAHTVIADWGRKLPGFSLITQNVDDLHDRAGTQNIIKLHGSIWRMECVNRCPPSKGGWRNEDVPLKEMPPLCPYCHRLARPGVVLFGEALDPAILSAAGDASECDVFITIGTSSVVYPAAGLLSLAKEKGAFTAEINPDATPASGIVDIAIAEGAVEALSEIDALL